MLIKNDWTTQGLSDEQLRPFGRNFKSASILAGAGSGKTRTLIQLVAAEIVSGIAPEDLVLFTFTENAAEELRTRITHLFSVYEPSVDLAKLKVGTIHSWCFQHLLDVENYINFTPIDELHLEALTTRFYDYLDLESVYGVAFPKGVDRFLSDLELFHNELLEIKDVPREIQKPIEKFQMLLLNSRLLSFGDMIRHSCGHLQRNGPLDNLRAVFVDEFQDVNPAQVSLIKSMIPSNCKLVVVGDDLQCIYQWRGSDVSQIIDFEREFVGSVGFKLLDNYRSRPQILEAVNAFSSCISKKIQNKTLRPKRPSLPVRTVIWNSYRSEQDEVNGVIQCIKKFVENGVPEDKIAVLFRSVANRGKPFVDALRTSGIPVWCPLHGRAGDFIRTFICPALEWIADDHAEPRTKVEEKEQEIKISKMEDALLRWIPNSTLLSSFWNRINDWHDACEAGKNEAYNIRNQIYTLLDVSGVRISDGDNELMSGLGIVSQIIRSIEEIHRRRIGDQERKSPKGVVKEVLYAIYRHETTFGESIPIDQSAAGVWVGTIHQAKGLEWPVVIVPMLKQRRFPVNSNKHRTSFSDSIAARYGTTKDDERRLFYVAMTRAKERLILTDPCSSDTATRSEFIYPIESILQINSNGSIDDNNEFWNIHSRDLHDQGSQTIRIGLSDLLLYLECPFQYGLRRSIGVQAAVGDELGYGLGLHEVIQRRIDHGSDWTKLDIDKNVNRWVHLPLMSESAEINARQSISNRIGILQDLGVLDVDTLPELHIEHTVGDGIVHGIADGLVRLDETRYAVRDWKSNIHDSLISRYERQMQFYVLSLRNRGYDVEYAELVDVGATEKSSTLIVRKVDTSQTFLDILQHTLETTIEGILQRQFPPRPSEENCTNCDLRKICGERWSDVTTN